MKYPPSEIAAVLLAAGASTRMGSPKALAPWHGATFLGSLLPAYAQVCGSTLVVLGHHAAAIRAATPLPASAAFVENPDPARGQLSSLQCGLAALPPAARFVFFQPVDAPGIAPATLLALLAAIETAPVAVPCFEGRHGHPVLIARAVAAELLALAPTATARDILRAHRPRTAFVEVPDPAILRDLDDPAALSAALSRSPRP